MSTSALPPETCLLLYTDGLVEARDPARRFFGTDRLLEAARQPAVTASEIRKNVLEALCRHTGAMPVEDDVTLVVVKAIAIQEEA
jgi:serine phosphatase RsbU (regulator of sigma subunit)